MKKALLITGGGVAAVAVALVAIPPLIDWSSYQKKVADKIEAATGRKVTIEGPVRLSLLPTPRISAHKIAVATIPGVGEAPLVQVESVDVHLAFLPLLRGTVELSSIAIKKPVVSLVQFPDGRTNWSFSPPGEKQTTPPSGETSAAAKDPSAPLDIIIGKATIEDGAVRYRGPTGNPVVVEGLDLALSAPGMTGPFAVEGDWRLNGTPIHITAGVDRLVQGADSPVRLNVRLPGSEAQFQFTGAVNGAQAKGQGQFELSVPNPGAALASLGVAATVPPGMPLSGRGEISGSAAEVSLQKLELSLGETHANGSVKATLGDVPKIDAQMIIAALDLDKLMKTTETKGEKKAPVADKKAPGTEKAAPAPFVLPKTMAATTVLGVNSLVWNGQAIKDVRFEAALNNGQLAITKAGATLPGGSTVALDGKLVTGEAMPGFEGKIHVRSDAPRATLAWAGVAVPPVAPERLQRLDFASAVRLAWPQVTLPDIRLTLDATKLQGSLGVQLSDRPALKMTATVDSIDLDSYKPPAAAATNKPPPAGKAAENTKKPAEESDNTALGAFDADVNITVQRIVMNQVEAKGLSVDGTLQKGTLQLRNLGVSDLGGAKIQLQGALRGLAGGAPSVEALKLQVNSPQPAKLIRFATGSVPDFATRLGALTANATLNGDAARVALDAQAQTSGLTLTANGTVVQLLTAPRANVAVKATHGDLASLLRLFSPTFRPSGNVGSFSLETNLAGDAKMIEASNLTLTAGAIRFSGQVRSDLTGARPRIIAELTGNALVLDPFLGAQKSKAAAPAAAAGAVVVAPAAPPAASGGAPFSREPLDVSALQAFDAQVGIKATSLSAQGWHLDQPVLSLKVQDGTATNSLNGKLLGGDLALDSSLGSKPQPTLNTRLNIAGADVGASGLGGGGINVTKGRLTFSSQLASSGKSTQEMAARLNGSGKFEVKDGIVSGFDLPAVGKQLNSGDNVAGLLGIVQSLLSGGQTPFSHLSASFRIDNGVMVSDDLVLAAQGGSANGKTTINLPRWDINSQTALRLEPSSAPPVLIKIQGPLDNPRKAIDTNALQQHFLARGVGQVLKGKGGEALGKEGGKVLNDVLKGLGGR